MKHLSAFYISIFLNLFCFQSFAEVDLPIPGQGAQVNEIDAASTFLKPNDEIANLLDRQGRILGRLFKNNIILRDDGSIWGHVKDNWLLDKDGNTIGNINNFNLIYNDKGEFVGELDFSMGKLD